MNGKAAVSDIGIEIFPTELVQQLARSYRAALRSERALGIGISALLHLALFTVIITSGGLPTWRDEPTLRASFVEFVPVDLTSAAPAPTLRQEALAVAGAVTRAPVVKRQELAPRMKPAPVEEPVVGTTKAAAAAAAPAASAGTRGAFEASAAGINAAARTGALRVSYDSAIISRLERAKRYPRRALQRHLEGEVMLALTLTPSGEVRSSTISKSSGHAFFDDEVLQMVERASPFPAAPAGLAGAPLEFLVPISFRLR